MNVKKIITNSITNIKENGIKKTFNDFLMLYESKKELKNSKVYKENIKKDILFINGCDLLHPKRYRVDNQIEQLQNKGITCDQVNVYKLKMKQAYEYRMFIIFRCPYNDLLEKFINEVKKLHKTVFFDIDDLVIDTKYTDLNEYVQKMSTKDKEHYDYGVNRINKTIKQCDYAITTTTRLKNELDNYFTETYINRNVVSKEVLDICLNENNITKDNGKIVRIGYFSGSISHNPDFEMIVPVIEFVFEKYSNVKLVIVGDLDIPKELIKYVNRIERKGFVDYRKLPNLIASVDINLVPLTKNIFNEAKSENKWVEASLVKVATIASNIGPYSERIEDGYNGVLCSNEDEWKQKLCMMIENNKLRLTIANNAYSYCLDNYTTNYIDDKLLNRIMIIISK